MDPREMASPACRVGRPNVDGSIGGEKGHPLPSKRPGRQYLHKNRQLNRQVTYPRRCPPITEQEHLDRAQHQETVCKGEAYQKEQLAWSHYLPTYEHSPVNFSYLVGRSTYAVPYHVVGPMSWEYPYHSGQAQEYLPDRLVPGSLYGLKVARPGYLSANYKPATAAQTLVAFDSSKGFVITSVTLMRMHMPCWLDMSGRATLGGLCMSVLNRDAQQQGDIRSSLPLLNSGPLEHLPCGRRPAVQLHGARV